MISADIVTSEVVVCSHWAGELLIEACSFWAVVPHGANGGGIVEDDNAHGVVTEVAGRAGLAGRLDFLVLVGSVLTPDGGRASLGAVMAHGASGERGWI